VLGVPIELAAHVERLLDEPVCVAVAALQRHDVTEIGQRFREQRVGRNELAAPDRK
jgi:hypothetical protein